MALRKNIIYNSILTVSNYIVPLVVFPYISRILGVDNFGVISFVDGVINFMILLSMLGVLSLGVREISASNSDPLRLNKIFSSLFTLNLIFTSIILIGFIISIFTVPKLIAHKELFYIGGFKILFNLFLIEWLYIGTGKFRFITSRTIIVRIVYVFLIFIFIRNKADYNIYYGLTVATVMINAAINWFYGRKIVKLSFKIVDLKQFLKPFLLLGAYLMFTSLYTSFNIIYLGMVSGANEIGYYSVATRIQGIFLIFFTAISTVIMPHISQLIADKNSSQVKNIIDKSVQLLYSLAIPAIYIGIVLAPQIILILSGKGYEGAILPMRIIMPSILIIGLAQIIIFQILMPLRNDKFILINSIFGATIGIILNLVLVNKLESVGSAIVWLSSEFMVLLGATYFVGKKTEIKIFNISILKHIILGIPYVLFCLISVRFFDSAIIIIIISSIQCLLYFLVMQVRVFKNDTIMSLFTAITSQIKSN